jgi:hypothetical protein
MYRCNTTWFDSSTCKLYEAGCSYEIDLEYMKKLGTLKYFYIPKTKKKKGTEK